MNTRIAFYLLMLFTFVGLSSCSDDSSEDEVKGNWTETIPFKGYERSGSVTFTINNQAYVALGYDGDDYLNDMYAYDHVLGYWQKMSSFPGTLRERAVAFTIGTKAYVGLGYNRNALVEELGDFWEYDTTTDAWTRLDDFAGGARYNAVAFSVNDRGYVGTGYDGGNTLGDFWMYDVTEDAWTEIQSLPGRKREEALAFVVGGYAYVCTGRNNGVYNTDFVRFNPSSNQWTSLEPDDDESYYDDFTEAVKRHNAIAVVLNERVFITTGIGSSGTSDSRVYEYFPANGEWLERTAFEGSARSEAVGFVVSDHIFVGLGTSGSRRFDDVWEFIPDEDYDSDN